MAGGINVGTAFVEIRPQTDGFGQRLDSQVTGAATTSGRQAGNRFSRGFSTSLAGLGRVVGAAVAGRALIGFLGDAVTEAQDAARVLAQTNAVIESTGGVANVTAGDVNTLADRLSRLAAVDDEVIASGANVLLTFTRVRNEVGAGNDIFDQATASALDVSAALGQDLQGAVMLVGKALNDPLKGMQALTRAGIQFTQQQKDQIAALVESGDLLGAQRIILGELETQFGGSAEANATAAMRWTVAMDNLKESIGTRVLPALTSLADKAGELIGDFEALDQPTQDLIIGLTGIAIAAGLAWIALGGIPALVIGTIVGIGAGLWYIWVNLDNIKKAADTAFTALFGQFPMLVPVLQGIGSAAAFVWGWLVRIAAFNFGAVVGSLQRVWAVLQMVWSQAQFAWGALTAIARIVIGTLGLSGLQSALNAALGPARTLLGVLQSIASTDTSKAVQGVQPRESGGGGRSAGGARLAFITGGGAGGVVASEGGGGGRSGGAATASEIGRAVSAAIASHAVPGRTLYLALSADGRPVERGSRGLRGSGL